MTNSQNLQQIMDKIWEIKIKGAALGWSGRQTYEAYKDLLPPEVTLIDFPSQSLNCAGYALGLNHSTSDPMYFLELGYRKVDLPEQADVYMMFKGDDWIHLGKVVGKGIAISKWAWEEPIFKHPLSFHPGPWDNIQYFRKV